MKKAVKTISNLKVNEVKQKVKNEVKGGAHIDLAAQWPQINNYY